ncbi:hypothetical protein ACET3X_008743 [Alternaria dauci]|uniref:DUF7888 domain-containing protein n=1 Tax=Alternaria dauci TaxID=48095 RepID=A0ABR3UDV3_9PLEO
MHFSKITCALALATSAMAAAVPAVRVEGTVDVSPAVVDKRAAPIAILLIKVIGGQLLAGAAKVAVDATKAHLEAEVAKDDFNNFDDARESFTKKLVQDLWSKKVPGTKGVACYNGPYSFSGGASYEGPVAVKFEWDMYNTDYDCFEIKSGTAYNKGDGGFINIAYAGQCQHVGSEYRC